MGTAIDSKQRETVHADPRSQHGSWGRIPTSWELQQCPARNLAIRSWLCQKPGNRGMKAKQVSNLNTKKVKLNWWEGLTTTAWKCWERQWIQMKFSSAAADSKYHWDLAWDPSSLLPVCLADILRQEAPWASDFTPAHCNNQPIDCLCPWNS